ncbi:hypothetical protein, conserved [Angomonas deanei]|uniref:START domain containing protein n=1 Tax=Angomonas deanei TaxID=59799 RepID=A0A7G2CBW2_9TRYP|nr:hypothetical protein, conserved [Angomonas deanei]
MLHQVVTNPKKQVGWKPVDFKDPKGDLILSSRPHVGPYNFARATMTLKDTHPVTVFNGMLCQDLAVRQEYSPNLTKYEILLRNPKLPRNLFPRDASGKEILGADNYQLEALAQQGIRDWHIEYNYYAAPPPVASRDFVYLIEKRYVPSEDCYYTYGTCVDYVDCVYRKSKVVRGAVLFAWKFQFINGDTHCTYSSCMNPNGWAPTFIVGWMKTEIGKEFQNSRRLTYLEKNREKDLQWYYQTKRAASPAAKEAKVTTQSAPISDDSDLDSEFDRQQTEEPGNLMQEEDQRIPCEEEDLIIVE